MSLLELSKTYKPFLYPQLVEAAIAHDRMHWIEAEANLQDDLKQWKSGDITPQEKYHITSILRLFTQSDMVVGGSYVDHFLPKIKNNEARMLLLSIAQREVIHQRAYALLNDTLGLPEEEYSAFLNFKEMAEKVEFMTDFNSTGITHLAQSIAKTVCNEGVSLFSAFAMLLNYQRVGKMKGMCEIVEWSIRDESTHAENMATLFRTLCNESPRIVNDEFKKFIYEMFTHTVALEDCVVDLAYNDCVIDGLDKEDVKQYIRYMADRRLNSLGLKEAFGIEKNPLPWIDAIVFGDSLKNFFEGRVTDYSADGLTGNWLTFSNDGNIEDNTETTENGV